MSDIDSSLGAGQRLRAARERAGISTRELSAMAGLSHSMAWLIESGRIASPRAEVFVRLADVLGLSLDWLISGRGECPPKAHIDAAVASARGQCVVTATGTEG